MYTCNCFCKIDIGKQGWGPIYRATTEKWHQIWICFEVSDKEIKVQIEILAFIFDWIFNQQLNLFLILSDWYCRKLGLTDWPGHDRKVVPDKKIVSISHQGSKGRNRDYCSHFFVTFETTGKFLIVFVQLILGKVGVDEFTRPRRESDVR